MTMNLERISQSPVAQALIGGVMAAAWIMFAYSHLQAFLRDGHWTVLLFCLSESVTAAMFLARSNPATVSDKPADWAIAMVGSFAPFGLAPVGAGVLPDAAILIGIGVLVQIAGMVSLNRSFGIVAARRTIKTGGLYRIVRHPLYASYFLTLSGYLLSNTSARNAALYALTMLMLAARAVREEQHLLQSEDYRQYMGRVKYRVIPYVF